MSISVLFFFRCHLAVQICVPVSNSSTNNSNNNTSKLTAAAVKAAFSQLQQSLLTDQLAFVTDNNMQQQPRVLLTPSSKTSIQDLLGSDRCSSSQPCISLLLLQHTGHSSRQQFSSNSAPLFECKPYQQQQQVAAVDLGLDVLCYVPLDMQAGAAVQTLLAPALQSQLLVMQQQLLQQVAEGQPLTPVKAYHFQPPALGGLPITICYPMLHESAETTELKLLGMRQQLHSLFGLPDNVPMLRISNALDWEAAWDDTQTVGRAVRLRNVHEGLAQPGRLKSSLEPSDRHTLLYVCHICTLQALMLPIWCDHLQSPERLPVCVSYRNIYVPSCNSTQPSQHVSCCCRWSTVLDRWRI